MAGHDTTTKQEGTVWAWTCTCGYRATSYPSPFAADKAAKGHRDDPGNPAYDRFPRAR